MKVLLVDTGTTRREYSEPIGIETLITYIKNAEVTAMSIELQGFENVISNIKSNNYNVIGISSKIGSFDVIKKLVGEIALCSSNAVICLGDIYGTYAYEDILKWNSNIICMIGEGEKNLPVLIDTIRRYGKEYRRYLKNIKSIAYYNQGVVVNEREKELDVKQALFPSRILLPDILKRNGIAHLEGSRGCVYGNCSFCGIVQKYGNPRWRPFEEEFIYNELITLSNAGVVSPYFTDEDFFGDNVERVIRIAQGIMELKKTNKLNPELNFYFNMRVDSVVGKGCEGYEKAREVLSLLKLAGLREVFIGVESGSSEQINRYKKNNEQFKSIKAIMTLNSLGIDVDIGFILFDPFMTMMDLINNLDFIYQAGINTNYSRLAKRLRIEPLTPYAKERCNSWNISESLDMETVSFPYSFIDSKVERVYKVFSIWEKEDMDIIYNLQSFCRGEVPSEEDRNKAKNIISMYRSLDVALLRKLSDYEMHNEDGNYSEIIGYFSDIRKKYDDAMQETIENYMAKYRRLPNI